MLDEFSLITRLTQSLPTHADVVLGVGDDCAILDLNADTVLLTTCDSQVEGVHFAFETASPEQIGRKALAVNLSDIAAMGGRPRFALISLILPKHFSLDLLEGIYAGLRQEAETFATAIVGGNIASAGKSEQLVLDITVVGTALRNAVLTRAGARVGDILCVTGHPGDSAAGLHTLLHPLSVSSSPERIAAIKSVQAAHRTPQPRVREGEVLARIGPGVVTALIDSSDGLSGDLGHICERSHTGARIDVAALPFSSSLLAIAAEVKYDPLLWALHGGEDYELLFTVAPEHVQRVCALVVQATGTPVTPIGRILPAEEGLQLLFADGHSESLPIKSWNYLSQGE